jgi:hypothetical protein
MKLDVDVNLHLLMNSIEDMKRQLENEKEEGRGWMHKYDETCAHFDLLVSALYRIWGHDETDPDSPQTIAKDALKKVNKAA